MKTKTGVLLTFFLFISVFTFISKASAYDPSYSVNIISRTPDNNDVITYSASGVLWYVGFETTCENALLCPDQIMVYLHVDGATTGEFLGYANMDSSTVLSKQWASIGSSVGSHYYQLRFVNPSYYLDTIWSSQYSYTVVPTSETVSISASYPTGTKYTTSNILFSGYLSTNVGGTAYLYIDGSVEKTWSISSTGSYQLTDYVVGSDIGVDSNIPYYFKFVSASGNSYQSTTKYFNIEAPPVGEGASYYWATTSPSNNTAYETGDTVTFSGSLVSNIGGSMHLFVNSSDVAQWSVAGTSTQSHDIVFNDVENITYYWVFDPDDAGESNITSSIKRILVYDYVLIPNPSYEIDAEKFPKRQPINISTVYNLTDYQMKVNLTYDSDMQYNFSDIRFTYSNNTLIPFWIEDYVNGTWASIWIRGNWNNLNGTQAYVYYGNVTASSESNPYSVFPLFDDFNDTSLNTTTWDVETGTPTEASDFLDLGAGEGIISDTAFTYGYTLEMEGKQGGNKKHNFGFKDSDYSIEHSYDGNSFLFDGADSSLNVTYPVDTLTKITIDWVNNTFAYLTKNDTETINKVLDLSDTSLKVWFQAWGAATADYYVDWVYMRTYANETPSYSFGSEEVQSGGMAISLDDPNQGDEFIEGTLNFTVTGDTSVRAKFELYAGSTLLNGDYDYYTAQSIFYSDSYDVFGIYGNVTLTAKLIRQPTAYYTCGGFIPCDEVSDSIIVHIDPAFTITVLSPSETTYYTDKVKFSSRVTNYLNNSVLYKLDLYKYDSSSQSYLLYASPNQWDVASQESREYTHDFSLVSGDYKYVWTAYIGASEPKISYGYFTVNFTWSYIVPDFFTDMRESVIDIITDVGDSTWLIPIMYIIFSPYVWIMIISAVIGKGFNLEIKGISIIAYLFVLLFSYIGWVDIPTALWLGLGIVYLIFITWRGNKS